MSTQPTHVDFYAGRGEDAEFLGTREYREIEEAPTFPVTLRLLQSLSDTDYSETDYRDTVNRLCRYDERNTIEPVWAHQHTDSTDTPWAVAYDKGTVYVYRYGVEVMQVRCNTHRWVRLHDGVGRGRASRPVNDFPTMS